MTLHIIGGDAAGENLAGAGLPGKILVWHDVLYDGPRKPGWPDEEALAARARFLEALMAGGLHRDRIGEILRDQYGQLAAVGDGPVVLWFDACLFDQSMLAHLLHCLWRQKAAKVELLCVDAFHGIEPFHGLGQLRPEQLASLYDRRVPVSDAQFEFAARVDTALAQRDTALLAGLAQSLDAPLPWLPAALRRWLEEQPDSRTGLGLLERLTLAAISDGHTRPLEIRAAVASADRAPHYWEDIILWATINRLADRNPPLVTITGPAERLPQWQSPVPLAAFAITVTPEGRDLAVLCKGLV